ncbi:DEAD/DEAH box helicase [Rickettsiales bacterium]|nr:DEAD/DEAH box helicase [Rickettsiales bacterium]
MENFSSFGLNKEILKNLKNLKLIKPTPIQIQAIKPALMGKDILGSAHTGTGKTAAFGLPLIHKLMQNHSSCALILTPTRELAVQVYKTLNAFMRNSGITSELIIGGESMSKQLRQLKKNPRLIIGTPGRIYDHLRRKSLSLNRTNYLVLDETDRMS